MAVSCKGAHLPTDIMCLGVRWYVAYALCTRQVATRMLACGSTVEHSTINHWLIT